jgi:ribosomal protein S18 acetylase RimI-like enzyme
LRHHHAQHFSTVVELKLYCAAQQSNYRYDATRPKHVTRFHRQTIRHSAILEILEEARQWIASQGINQWRMPFTAEWIEQRIEAQEFHCLRCDNHPIAVFRLLESDPDFWPDAEPNALYVHSLAVRRGYAGHGIGLSCLRWAEAQAKACGKHYLRLDCVPDNARLCTYYEQAGFTPGELRQAGPWSARLFQKPVN